jgi:hypothetical protein
MARRPEVEHTKLRFLASIASARSLANEILAIPQKVNPQTPGPGLYTGHVGQVIELAFMGMVASWEEFLEQVLVRYVAGASAAPRTPGTPGYRPTPKYGLATSLSHAYEVLTLNPNFSASRDFLKVSDPKWVKRTVDFFFTTHPFGVLTTNADSIRLANKIRDRVAHDSEKCRTDFKEVAVHFLRPGGNKLRHGYTPGHLLLDPVRRRFPQAMYGHSHFEAYQQMYEDMASVIVP